MRIKPLLVEIKYEEDGTPYLHYIGEYFFNEGRFIIDIPHIDLTINGINVTEDLMLNNGTRVINASINLAEKDGMLFAVTKEEEQEQDCFIW